MSRPFMHPTEHLFWYGLNDAKKKVFGSSFEIDDVYFGKFIAFFRISFHGKKG